MCYEGEDFIVSDLAVAAPYRDTLVVKPEWLDENGHMNVANYLRAFDHGGEVFFRDCGIGWDYTREGEGTIFMTNCDLDFRRELLEDDPLEVTTQLMDGPRNSYIPIKRCTIEKRGISRQVQRRFSSTLRSPIARALKCPPRRSRD